MPYKNGKVDMAGYGANMGNNGAEDRAKQRRKKLANSRVQASYNRGARPGSHGYTPTRNPVPPIPRVEL